MAKPFNQMNEYEFNQFKKEFDLTKWNEYKKNIECCIEILKMANVPQKEVKEAEIADYSAVFNADYYYNRYPDLQVTIGKDAKALLEHFVDFGMKEGRVGNAAFDVKAYMKNNPDLVGLLKAEDLVKLKLLILKE